MPIDNELPLNWPQELALNVYAVPNGSPINLVWTPDVGNGANLGSGYVSNPNLNFANTPATGTYITCLVPLDTANNIGLGGAVHSAWILGVKFGDISLSVFIAGYSDSGNTLMFSAESSTGIFVGFNALATIQIPLMDPYSNVYQKILSILSASPLVNSVVNVVNIIDQTTGEYTTMRPEKASRQAGDLPEIGLYQGRFSDMPAGGNSMSSDSVQTYILALLTDTPQIGGEVKPAPVSLNTLKWAIKQALASSTDDTLGLPFVFTYSIRGGPDLPEGKMTLPNYRGRQWSAAYAIDVKFMFPQALLAEFAA